eukprot:SAG11_NODE_56_length_19295_cov_20.219675_21_plen_99_part_00
MKMSPATLAPPKHSYRSAFACVASEILSSLPVLTMMNSSCPRFCVILAENKKLKNEIHLLKASNEQPAPSGDVMKVAALEKELAVRLLLLPPTCGCVA